VKASARVEEAVRWRLAIGEPLLAGGFAWIAFPRPQVSTLVLNRRPHLVGVTDRRLLIWARPHEVRPAEDQDLVLDSPLDAVTLEGVRSFSPLLQVRLTTASGRKLVLEFRPRDRRLGRRLAEALTADVPAAPTTEVPTAAG
jgi:hypothetical protein